MNIEGFILGDHGHTGGVSGQRPLMGAVGPLSAKRACLPQGLEVGARSAPQLLVNFITVI